MLCNNKKHTKYSHSEITWMFFGACFSARLKIFHFLVCAS